MEDERKRLFTRINSLAARFHLVDRVPLKSAAVSYLGLCRMKVANDRRQNDAMERICREIYERLRPEESGKAVNCSHFSGDKKFRDHSAIITNATGIYLSDVRSRKKRGLVLLAVGAMHDDDVPIPPDDSWIDGYLFG